MVTIPSGVFTKYREYADAMIDQFGINCTIYYPSKREVCSNCVADGIGNKSGNVFKSGGHANAFNRGCVYCGGNGYKEVEYTDTISLRVYHRASDFRKVTTLNVDIPEGTIMVIGYIYDLPKFERANYIKINTSQEAYREFKYERQGEPRIHGLQHNRYFLCFMSRI